MLITTACNLVFKLVAYDMGVPKLNKKKQIKKNKLINQVWLI